MKALGVLLGSTLGKLLGLVREITLAYFLGATGAADAFRISLIATLLPTQFFMGDVLDGAFVPLYARYLRTNPASGRRLLGLTSMYLIAISSVLTLVMWLAGPTVIRVFAPGLPQTTVHLAAAMLRWMGLGIPFFCFASLYSLYGICHDRFRPLALRSAFQNATLVLIIPVAAWLGDAQWLGVGFPLAFLAYLGYTWYSLGDLRRGDAAAARKVDPAGGEMRGLLQAATPLVVTMVLGQLLAAIDRAAASFAGVGAVASLDYARAFVETPQVLLGYAVGTVALSRFSSASRDTVPAQAAALIFPLITGVLGLMLIVIVGAPELVTIAYRRGRFDAGAVTLVSDALRGLGAGAAFMMAVYIMMRIISAQMRNRENIVPMAVAVLVEGATAVLLVPRLGLLGVGLAVSLMQVTLFTLLAARLGMLADCGRRLPGWLLGLGAVALATVASSQLGDGQPIPVRLGLSILLVGIAWILGNIALAPTRADLAVLTRHVGRAYTLLQGRLAAR
jgi:putative peptidoglycan lipid II flippase